MPERVVVLEHVLRNVSLPVVTAIALQLSSVVSGAVVTEVVFGWPGAGRLAVNAVIERDYAVVQVVVALSALAIALLNVLVDALYVYLDPRVSFKAKA